MGRTVCVSCERGLTSLHASIQIPATRRRNKMSHSENTSGLQIERTIAASGSPPGRTLHFAHRAEKDVNA